jgi:DNA relaxase NicK
MYEGNVNTEKSLFVLSGTVCDRIGVDSKWLSSLLSDNATVSRLDLCVTTDVNILKKVQSDREKIESELYREMKIISDAEYTPQTIYIGDMQKRKKKGIVRFYDKALQLGLDELDMFRYEIEMKQKHAQIGAKRLASGESIPSVMNSKFRVNAQWYEELMGSEISTKRFDYEEEEEEEEIIKKMAWLERQVLPSIQYVIDYDRDNGTENFKRLLSLLEW